MQANFAPAPETPITVTITDPKNKVEIQSNQFILNYTVTDIPQETINSYAETILFNIRVSLDGTWIIDPYTFKTTISNSLSFNHSINITKVPDGNHSLTILVYCKKQINGNTNSNLALQGSSEATYFSTLQNTQTSTALPTPTNIQQSLQLPSTVEIVAIVVLVVFALGLTLNLATKRKNPR